MLFNVFIFFYFKISQLMLLNNKIIRKKFNILKYILHLLFIIKIYSSITLNATFIISITFNTIQFLLY